MDCCKEELPFILPTEVPVQQQQQQPETAEPQSSSTGDTASGEAEQMSSSNQTAGDVAETVTEETSTADVSLDPAVSTDVQEDVVEPMELDQQQITIPPTTTATIIPTGKGTHYGSNE